nr:nudix hydrolase 20, chloroplastic-like isoform X1 [Ipomoea batatas]
MLCRFADHLRAFRNVFVFPKDNSYGSHFGCHVTLQQVLKTPEDRTAAFAEVVKSLGEELIPGIRNELYPVVSSFGTSIFFSMERAAAPYFGIKVRFLLPLPGVWSSTLCSEMPFCWLSSFNDLISCLNQPLPPSSSTFWNFASQAYGVHMNGYVESNGQKFLWIGKRSEEKSTYPGMLDHLVAGGLVRC